MSQRSNLVFPLLVVAFLMLAACGGGTPVATSGAGSTAAESDASTEAAAAEGALRPVTVAMGYIPNVQFAPFYVAIEKGYFAEEGIALTLDYGMESDLVELVAANQLQFAIASGDQVLLSRASGRAIRYVANWYRRFPVAVTSIELDLRDPTVLEGKTVGLPGLFGANYIGWLALVDAAGLDADTIRLEAIGFNQVPVLIEERVDAAVVYAINEPLQLREAGYEPSTLLVADVVDLVANGLVTNEATIQNEPELVLGMVRAMLRGIQATLADPDEAFAITRAAKWGTGIDDATAATQRAVLEAALPFWRNETPGLVPPESWQASQDFMLRTGLLQRAVPLEALYTPRFVEAAAEK